MLRQDDLRKALREKGYGELRSIREGFMSCTLMTDGIHVLILQEYADGWADLYIPIVPDDQMNDLEAVIQAIPERHPGNR